jgi:hypothetical protein
MNITERIEMLRNMPKAWRVTTHYADGSTMVHDAALEVQAQNWAVGERRKIGRKLIERATGTERSITSVTISRI